MAEARGSSDEDREAMFMEAYRLSRSPETLENVSAPQAGRGEVSNVYFNP
jgi:hypothetical protein